MHVNYVEFGITQLVTLKRTKVIHEIRIKVELVPVSQNIYYMLDEFIDEFIGR